MSAALDCSPGPAAAAARPRFRAALEYVVDGDLRFLSHHDELRMLTRALVRAGWPLAYSQGFNPQPRLSIPLPRSVGSASLCQWAVVELAEDASQQELVRRLRDASPDAVVVKQVICPASLSTPQPRRAVYEVDLSPQHAEGARCAADALLQRQSVVIERRYTSGKPPVSMELRPLIEAIELDGVRLRLRLAFDGQRSARPGEVLELLGVPLEGYSSRVRRIAVTWDKPLTGR